MADWKVVQVTLLVLADEAEDVHRTYARLSEYDESKGGWVETRELTEQDREDFGAQIDDYESEERAPVG